MIKFHTVLVHYCPLVESTVLTYACIMIKIFIRQLHWQHSIHFFLQTFFWGLFLLFLPLTCSPSNRPISVFAVQQKSLHSSAKSENTTTTTWVCHKYWSVNMRIKNRHSVNTLHMVKIPSILLLQCGSSQREEHCSGSSQTSICSQQQGGVCYHQAGRLG